MVRMTAKARKAAQQAAYDAQKRIEQQQDNLVRAAINKFSFRDMMEAAERVADADDLKEWALYYLSIQSNTIVIKPQSMAEAARIEEFLDEMYPLLNEKQLVLPMN